MYSNFFNIIYTGGNRTTLESSGAVIENNEIYSFNRLAAAGRAGIGLKGVGHLVRQNTIYKGRTNAIVYNVRNEFLTIFNDKTDLRSAKMK